MRILLILLISVLLGTCSAVADQLKIIVPKDVLVDYDNFLQGRDPLKITDFSGECSRRDVVELVFIQQALREGGIQTEIRFLIANAYTRIQREIEQGRVAMAANSIWLADLKKIEEYVYISIPSIENGEFEAGFYTVPGNKKAMSAKNLKDIRQLIGLSNKNWVSDWNTLTGLKLKGLHHTTTWNSMLKMVNKGRADFLLAPFQPSRDFSFEAEGIKFVPIPNLKVELQGSRHFGISKRYPKGKEVFDAFNRGLINLKDRGVIGKAYQESGFFNKRVTDWKRIN